jgi:hypothetical protein
VRWARGRSRFRAIGSTQIAAWGITAAQIAGRDHHERQAGPRRGAGPHLRDLSRGQYLRGVTSGGVICGPFFVANLSTTVHDPANTVGGYTAIGADGLPVISHRDLTASALRVTKCGDAANVSTTRQNGDCHIRRPLAPRDPV